MKKSLIFIGLSILSVLILSTISNAALYRTLRQGSTGADVRELQVLLNKDPETRIALTGAGSPGRETTSFGSLTRQAVIKFQAKYAGDVLYPAGISFPTGVVGQMTRAKLSALYPSGSPASQGGSLPAGNVNPPRIDSISPSIISSSSQSLTISGSGFTSSGNSVIVASDGDRSAGSYTSVDGKTITISFTSTAVEKIKTQLAIYKNAYNYQSILSAIIDNLSGETISVEGGVTYVRVILLVRNSAGESNPVTVKVDIKSLLQ